MDIEELFDDKEYNIRAKNREEELVKRRSAKKKKQQIKNKIILACAALFLLTVIITIIVLTTKFIGEKTTVDEAMIATESIDELPDDYITEDEPANDEIYKDYLGFNPTIYSNDVVIDNISLFKGYKLNLTDDTYVMEECDDMQSLYSILVDARTGNVICHNDGFEIISPASMTKVMTVLVAAEHISKDELNNEVEITETETGYSFKHDLSAVGFMIGEKVTVKDLFYGTILPSGADAAMALARYVAGDEESFVNLMNEKADELGLQNTHFTNVAGMYNENHYSTCAEMAIIMKAAIENEFCYEVLKLHTYTTPITPEHPEGITVSNWFLRRIEDKEELFGGTVICAKTGFVNQSGNCAVSFEVNNSGNPYICVTVNAHSVWRCIYDQVYIYSKVM